MKPPSTNLWTRLFCDLLGLGTMTDMDEVLAVILSRSVAVIRRTEFAGWLDSLG